MYLNDTKKALTENKAVLGTFVCLNSTAVCEVLARSGFNYLVIDMEHGLMGIDTASDMIMTMNGTGVTPIIRVQQNEESIINRALGAGAYGIMIPLVNSVEEAKRAVKACKYPPDGIRGVGPGHMSLFGLDLKNYLENANKQVLTILQVEHIDAVNSIDEITEIEGIDVIFVGPSDLASSMNLLGHPDDPSVQEAIEKVLKTCLKKKITAGIYCNSPEVAIKRIKEGFQFITYGLDARFLSIAAEQTLEQIKTNCNL